MDTKTYIVNVKLKPGGIVQRVRIQATDPLIAKQIAERKFYEVISCGELDPVAQEAKRQTEEVQTDAERRDNERTVREIQENERQKNLVENEEIRRRASELEERRHRASGRDELKRQVPEEERPQRETGDLIAEGFGEILGKLFGSRTEEVQLSQAEIEMRSAIQAAARSVGTAMARQVIRELGGVSNDRETSNSGAGQSKASSKADEDKASDADGSTSTRHASSHLDALERLGKLRDSGVLTQDEFEAEKKRILLG